MKNYKVLLVALLVSYVQVNAQVIEAEKDNSLIYTTASTSPAFPGGADSLKVYLKNNVKYPNSYLVSGKTEVAFVKLIIEKDGRVSGIEGMSENPTECPKEFFDEAERVALNMPRWSPGKHGSKLVRCYYFIAVKFCPEGCAEWRK